MKELARAAFAVVTAAALFAACSKEKDSGSIRFDRPALYLAAGETATVGFSLADTDARTLSVTSRPTGWEQIALDAAARTLTVTAPASADGEDVAVSGSVVVSGTSGGGVVSGTLFVGIARSEDFSARPANSYIAAREDTEYRFDAVHKNDGTALATARIGVVWQSASKLVRYLHFDGSCGSFYVGAEDGALKEGNALIGAYDAHDKLIWSWHVWVSDFDPDENPLVLDGGTMMTRNLGALANGCATDAEKLASYGLFYQWGRKEPFVGPLTYDAADGLSSAMYDGDDKRVYLTMTASTSETGTMAYAAEHPLEFLVVDDKDADWLQNGTAARWSGAAKSVYDPCPYGWRVAPASAYEGLTIQEELTAEDAAYGSQYGWVLGNGTSEVFFPGGGRRSWLDGKVHNYFDESLPVRSAEMQPWVGYYWTADAAEAAASAFCFWYKAGDAAASGVRNGRPMGRANGMSVRCVRDE